MKRHARQQAAPRLTHFAHADTAQHESWRQAGEFVAVRVAAIEVVQGAEVEYETGDRRVAAAAQGSSDAASDRS